ncbi:diaminopimelate epimerase [Nocardioides sp. URHA0032]|uniref:diaminopimelate epimerase n=1 Tax=Nocardioides sp. URHA0032 TaxID=1380388 RepID=UPI00048CE916|nr:diaminopimelate epimerase [Nocardioides sp. URHA0032]
MPDYEYLLGHGTENDFVLLPDLDGTVHGDLSPEQLAERVRALCDRRAGIGGDGVLRVLRQGDGWFMDYRNADGSLSEMCGNGIRVFARYLVDAGLADPARPIPVDTRDGVKVLTVDGDLITADMGTPQVLGETKVGVAGRAWVARHVDMGNPHAVAFVDDLADAGPLLEAPEHDPATYPRGVNVEFVVRRGARHLAMRVHERGSGETRSCGTGACAVMVAAAVADGAERSGAYRVDVPGGTLTVTWTDDDRVLLTGRALIVARGTTSL